MTPTCNLILSLLTLAGYGALLWLYIGPVPTTQGGELSYPEED